ncbi:hypothetical protein H6G64_00995 [Calothrix sp. FACHB-156]|nr:hypothetical protein [Calothrix sp. FACHB-156]
MVEQEIKNYRGYWWLPHNPNTIISGNLCINPNKGIELDTVGSLLSIQEVLDAVDESDTDKVLLGKTVDGKAVTLIDWYHSKSNRTYSDSQLDLSISSYSAKFAIVGKRHFINKDEIIFTSAEARFNLLDEWLSVTGFNFHEKEDERGFSQFNLEYVYPNKLEFYIDDISSTFSTNYFFNTQYSNLNWRLSHKSFLKLTPDKSESLDWYMKQFYEIQKLLTIMTGFPVDPIAFRGYGIDININKEQKIQEEFEIYLQTHNNFNDNFENYPTQLLLTVPHLRSQLSVIVNNWFRKAEILAPAITLYVATISTRLGYAEFQLLNYAQALEALHRRVFGGQYMSDEEYTPISTILIDNIPNNLSKSHRDSLKSRLKYANEFSQRKRIKELLDQVWENCLTHFIHNKNEFIDQVISTRNYLIHYDESSASKAVFGSEIFYLAQRLKILLLTHILINIGNPQESVYLAIKGFEPFQYLKKRN